MSAPRVLFLHANSEEYMADSLLHGLRVVLGDAVVDVPRRDALYDDLSDERRSRLYGRGFTLYGRLPEVAVEREGWLDRVLSGEFDLVIFADIWRYWAPWVQLRPHLRRLRALGVQLVAIDGGDGTFLFPHGPRWWRQMRPWPLPRIQGRMEVFKRELAPSTAWSRAHGLLPPRLASRLLMRRVHPLAFSIPEDCLAQGDEEKRKLLATHIVDPEVAELASAGQTKYAFEREEEYYADLRESRFAVTTKKAGWETLRHYEIAASGCVPCFRDLQKKPPLTAPFGLHAGNCVAYSHPGSLLSELEAIDQSSYADLRSGALEWARRNTTRVRAQGLLSTFVQRPAEEPSSALPQGSFVSRQD